MDENAHAAIDVVANCTDRAVTGVVAVEVGR